MVTFIHQDELEQIARRVWYAHRDIASRINDDEKHASFERLGYRSQSTEFPMRSGEWVVVGGLDISISYPKWDIPGYIRVRKHQEDER